MNFTKPATGLLTADKDVEVWARRLEEKVDGVGKRLENQEFISRGVLVTLIVAILGGFAKLFGFAGKIWLDVFNSSIRILTIGVPIIPGCYG